jgi:hypothetical protein
LDELSESENDWEDERERDADSLHDRDPDREPLILAVSDCDFFLLSDRDELLLAEAD